MQQTLIILYVTVTILGISGCSDPRPPDPQMPQQFAIISSVQLDHGGLGRGEGFEMLVRSGVKWRSEMYSEGKATRVVVSAGTGETQTANYAPGKSQKTPSAVHALETLYSVIAAADYEGSRDVDGETVDIYSWRDSVTGDDSRLKITRRTGLPREVLIDTGAVQYRVSYTPFEIDYDRRDLFNTGALKPLLQSHHPSSAKDQ